MRRANSKQPATDVDYLDVIMCWKGISTAQAVELTIWERLFQQCLVSHFESHMRRNIVAELSALRDHIDEDELWPCLTQILPTDHKRLVRIDLPDLIHNMIDALYDELHSETVATNMRWSLGFGDLPNFVFNYIMTHDYLLRFSDGLYLSVEIFIAWKTMPVLAIVAAVVSQPPNVDIWRMHFGSKDRDAVVLYFERIFSVLGSSSYKYFPEDVVCEVKEHRAKVDTSRVSETIVQAKTITQFPDDVRFERVSRYAVKGEVMDIRRVDATPDNHTPQQKEFQTPWVPSYTSTPLSKTRRRKAPVSPSPDEKADFLATSITDAFMLSGPDLPAGSPKKRKASLRSTSFDGTSTLQSADHESNAYLKRQRLESSGDIHLLTTSTSTEVIALQKKLAAIAQDVDAMCKRLNPPITQVYGNGSDVLRYSEDIVRRLREAVASSHPSVPTVFATDILQQQGEDRQKSLIGKGKIVVLPPTPALEQYDSLLPRSSSPICLTSEPDDSDAISPNSAINVSSLGAQQPGHGGSANRRRHLTELSQDEIQKNYREFEAVAQRRMTDPTYAPVGDVGEMNFEHIFLGDSEVEDLSLGDIDGLSEEMSGLDMGGN
ncbi:hypothetical protein J4E91_005156 [Alternaria rosae]|nr:hypothetical protein J4E91_005156 [Alternaria rosae]